MFLDAPVAGVTPAPIADADYLAALNLTRETFTVVGYGDDAFITGSVVANHPIVLNDGIRSFRDVSVITRHDAFPDRFLKITQSTCFGDSGGPLFHDGTVVGISTWTFELRLSGRLRGGEHVPRREPLGLATHTQERGGPTGPPRVSAWTFVP